jgi:hypothetical protein
MDLHATDRLDGKLDKVKAWALACFAVAGALLIASLFIEPPAQQGADRGGPAAHTGSLR